MEISPCTWGTLHMLTHPQHDTPCVLLDLEQMVPYSVFAMNDHPLQKDDGIMTVYDMAQKENLKLYSEDKYWNLDVKDEFMSETRNLWQGNFKDKRDGSIFSLPNEMD